MIIAFPLFGFAQTYALPNLDNLDTLLISNEPIQNKQSSTFNVSLTEKIGVSSDGKKPSKIAEGESNFLKKLNQSFDSMKIAHEVILTEKISLSENGYAQNPAYNLNTKIQTSLERIWNSQNLRPEKNRHTFVNQLLNSYNYSEISENAKIGLEKDSEILVSVLGGKIGSSNLLTIFPSQPSIIEPQGTQLLAIGVPDFLTESEAIDSTLPLAVLVLFSGFVLLRFENNDQIKFQNFRRFTCYIFIILLISSMFTIPHSISSAYWPDAYAEKPIEFDESASVIPGNATNTEIIEFDESVSVIPGNDTKVKGKPADNEPKGKPADNEPKGKPADN
ncbi:hypothetical protein LCGC14_2029050, partial [marine sediment metagenome]